MHKTILVIGDVSREQYMQVLLEVIASGHSPEVVRLSIGELFIDNFELIRRFGCEDPEVTLNQREITQIYLESSEDELAEYADKQISQYGDIRAIVMSQKAFESWSSQRGHTYERLREHDDVRWVVSASGSPEFIGG